MPALQLNQAGFTPDIDSEDKFQAYKKLNSNVIATYSQYVNYQWCYHLKKRFDEIPLSYGQLNADETTMVENFRKAGIKLSNQLLTTINYNVVSQAKITGFLVKVNNMLNMQVNQTSDEDKAAFKTELTKLGKEAELFSRDLTPSAKSFFLNSVMAVIGAALVLAAFAILPTVAHLLVCTGVVAGAGGFLVSAGSLTIGATLATIGFYKASRPASGPAKEIGIGLADNNMQGALTKIARPRLGS
jgi:hypothetical protein